MNFNVSPFMDSSQIVESATFQNFADNEPCVASIFDSNNEIFIGSKVVACVICRLTYFFYPVALKKIVKANSYRIKESAVRSKRMLFEDLNVSYAYQSISPRHLDYHALLNDKRRHEFVIESAIDLIKQAKRAKINVSKIVFGRSINPFTRDQQNDIRSQFMMADISAHITLPKKSGTCANIIAASLLARLIKDEQLRELCHSKRIQLKHGSAEAKNFLACSIDAVFGYPDFVQVSRQPVQKAIEKDCHKISWTKRHTDVDATSTTKGTFFQKRKVAHAVEF